VGVPDSALQPKEHSQLADALQSSWGRTHFYVCLGASLALHGAGVSWTQRHLGGSAKKA
jgi:hypothetical protein